MGFERVFGFISSYGDVHMSEAVQRFPQLESLSDEGLRTSEGRMNTHKPANQSPCGLARSHELGVLLESKPAVNIAHPLGSLKRQLDRIPCP